MFVRLITGVVRKVDLYNKDIDHNIDVGSRIENKLNHRDARVIADARDIKDARDILEGRNKTKVDNLDDNLDR